MCSVFFTIHNLRDLNFNAADGFVRDESNIWIQDKGREQNPSNTDVTISKAFRFVMVYGTAIRVTFILRIDD